MNAHLRNRSIFVWMLALAAVLVMSACGNESSPPPQTGDNGGSSKVHSGDPQVSQPKEIIEVECAVMKTSMGTVVIRLYEKEAPKAVENLKRLSKKGYYDGLIFHRVINGFMIQGGDPLGTGYGGQSIWGVPFEDEFDPSLRFDRKGLLAMANGGPKTNGSQFFITLGPTPHLNDKHTIYGEVIEGLDVVEAIGSVETAVRDKPVKDVVIEAITFEERKIEE